MLVYNSKLENYHSLCLATFLHGVQCRVHIHSLHLCTYNSVQDGSLSYERWANRQSFNYSKVTICVKVIFGVRVWMM
jgi:hypothetical protein